MRNSIITFAVALVVSTATIVSASEQEPPPSQPREENLIAADDVLIETIESNTNAESQGESSLPVVGDAGVVGEAAILPPPSDVGSFPYYDANEKSSDANVRWHNVDFTRDGRKHPSHQNITLIRDRVDALRPRFVVLRDYSNINAMRDYSAQLDAFEAQVQAIQTDMSALCTPIDELIAQYDKATFETRETLRTLHAALMRGGEEAAVKALTEQIESLSADLEASEVEWSVLATTRQLCRQIGVVIGAYAPQLMALRQDYKDIMTRRALNNAGDEL